MDLNRKWYCSCSGKPVEMTFVEVAEEEPAEPACNRCGATPSSDPRKTVTYKDREDWDG